VAGSSPVNSPPAKRRRLLRALLLVAVNVLVPLALVEGVIVTMLASPSLSAASPAPVLRLLQQVYRHFNRSLIQYEPACARYDAELAYILRSGSCVFENLEFRTEVQINRLGLRDTDAALAAPEIIVLGDSHAMGWGVGQNETIARVLEAQLGTPVLNAAMSSYGTVREARLLNRLDTSQTRALVVQYSDNDLPENRTFRDAGNHLPVMSEREYDSIVEHYRASTRYYPGKYVFRLFMKGLRLEAPDPGNVSRGVATPEEEAALFLNALLNGTRARLDQVALLVVFEINQSSAGREAFTDALAATRNRAEYPAWVRTLVTIDTASLLSPDDFYVLDDHMKASGHRKVASRVADVIRERLIR
jgi:hypothetical protein